MTTASTSLSPAKPVIRQVPAPSFDSKLFHILDDQEIRSKFNREAYAKLFFSTNSRDAQKPIAQDQLSPRTDIRGAYRWAPEWDKKRVQNSTSSTTTKSSYKEMDKGSVVPSIPFVHEPTARIFYQPPDVPPTEYQHKYLEVDNKHMAERIKIDKNVQSVAQVKLATEMDSVEHDNFKAHERKNHRPKICMPFETEREMSKRTRHLQNTPKTQYQAFCGVSPRPKPHMRKEIAESARKA
jgi:hypothetical protein